MPKEVMADMPLGSEPGKRRRILLKKIACPGCGKVGTLKKILYGMPGDDFEFERFIVGGCIVNEADVGCVECNWAGIREDLDGQHRQ